MFAAAEWQKTLDSNKKSLLMIKTAIEDSTENGLFLDNVEKLCEIRLKFHNLKMKALGVKQRK